MDDLVVDHLGNEIGIGDTVRLRGSEFLGTVKSISDPDGDYQDGFVVYYSPAIEVVFDDGVIDTFSTSWNGRWYNDPGEFESSDLEVC